MLSKDDCYHIGFIAKSHGIEGEVVLKLKHNITDILKKLGSIFIDIDGGLVPFFFKQINNISEYSCIVLIQDYTEESQVKRLLNKELYINKKLVKLKDDNSPSFQDVNGYIVIDINQGEIGVAKEIVEYNSNILLSTISDKEDEILIPFTDSIILNIDNKQKEIKIDAPEGLLSLNDRE